MKKYLILIFVALAAVFQSCDNNDDLWDAIDDLKSRVQALETQVDALNGNIEALQKLYGGATISKVETSDGKYVVTLTNGETIELVQGSEAVAVIPIVSINDKGEWQVSTDNGATFTSLGVKAVAEDGTTPRFRIDEATGYWQVSYDGGTSFENVKDTKGQPVKAIGSGTVTDKFFEEVKVDGGDLYIRLLGGEELRIPIVSDFFCRIVTPTEGVQTFDAGATKRFVVEIRGVEQVKLSAPEGWSARLTDAVDERAELIVTAPAAVTRATADTSKDVAIEAFAAGGLSTVAKIQVESTGTAPAAPTDQLRDGRTHAVGADLRRCALGQCRRLEIPLPQIDGSGSRRRQGSCRRHGRCGYGRDGQESRSQYGLYDLRGRLCRRSDERGGKRAEHDGGGSRYRRDGLLSGLSGRERHRAGRPDDQ